MSALEGFFNRVKVKARLTKDELQKEQELSN